MTTLFPTIEVSDVREGASAPAPVAFLLAGFPDDHSAFAPLAQELKKKYKVIIACFPLYDQSSVEKDQKTYYTQEEIYYSLEATIFKCTKPGEKITLIIHDFGCYFGSHFAFLHPEKIEKLVTMDIGCTTRCLPAAAGSKHAYGLAKFPDAPRKKDKLQQMFYQLYFCMAYTVGSKVGFGVGDAILQAFFSWAKYVGFLQKTSGEGGTKHSRDAKEIKSFMCYPYWALWRRILFAKKTMLVHTYKSEFTHPKEVQTGFQGLLPVYIPYPETIPTLFMYGKRKAFHFHSYGYVDHVKKQLGCAAMGVDGGHWFFLDQPKFSHKVVLDFLKGVLYPYSPM